MDDYEFHGGKCEYVGDYGKRKIQSSYMLKEQIPRRVWSLSHPLGEISKVFEKQKISVRTQFGEVLRRVEHLIMIKSWVTKK